MKGVIAGFFIVLGLILFAFIQWPKPSPPILPLAGTYISQTDNEVSWIVLTTKEQEGISCLWHKIQVAADGKLKEQKLELTGKTKGNAISLSARLLYPKPMEVMAVAVREGENIRMSLSTEGKVFYTGQYAPSDRLTMISAVSTLKKNASAIAEASQEKKQQQKQSVNPQASNHAAARSRMIEDGKISIQRVKQFIDKHRSVVKGYKKNTARIKNYLNNVKKYSGAENKENRTPLIVAMREIASATGQLHKEQEIFVSDYTNHLMPFLSALKKQQKNCTETTDKMQTDLCAIAGQVLKIMQKQHEPLQQAINEVYTSYAKELTEQLEIIAQAEQVQ